MRNDWILQGPHVRATVEKTSSWTLDFVRKYKLRQLCGMLKCEVRPGKPAEWQNCLRASAALFWSSWWEGEVGRTSWAVKICHGSPSTWDKYLPWGDSCIWHGRVRCALEPPVLEARSSFSSAQLAFQRMLLQLYQMLWTWLVSHQNYLNYS